ncbi:MAG: hypothetical protein AB8C46_17040 [Burkholderiaceae bacterium]
MTSKDASTAKQIDAGFRDPLTPAGRAALETVESKRGYTLPYHRLFAAHSPSLLTKYDAFYEALTLEPRELSPYERETVWACLLAAVREVHGSIHLKRAHDAGLSDADLARCVAIAATTHAFPVLAFSGTNWSAWTDRQAMLATYESQFAYASAGLPTGLAHLAATAAMAGCREANGMLVHLKGALAADATCAQVTEALSYLLLPCGGNVLIDAVAAWEAAAEQGEVISPY